MKIARKHILAAIESVPCKLEYPRYTLEAGFYRQVGKSNSCSGVRVMWTIKPPKSRRPENTPTQHQTQEAIEFLHKVTGVKLSDTEIELLAAHLHKP